MGETMNWQPIETAPKDGTEFVTCNMRQGGVKELVWWNHIHDRWQRKGETIDMQASHWMSLPLRRIDAPPSMKHIFKRGAVDGW